MVTKTITGSYPSGYYLKPQFQALSIAQSATVGGNGVTTSASQPSTITNYGKVQGTGNGITLSDGGTITNQSGGQIEGATAILASGGYAALSNAGTIKSDTVVAGYATTVATSVVLGAGGKVAQTMSGATIANGVSISGGSGNVVNRGTIGGSTYDYFNPNYQTSYRNEIYRRGPSVSLAGGGTVNNGANGATDARLTSGVAISGGPGNVINNGTIDGTIYNNYGYDIYKHVYASISMSGGGTIQNGTGSNTSATLTNGISLTGGTTKIVNNGTIGYGTFTYVGGHVDATFPTYSINARSQFSLVNGSASNTKATLTGGIFVSGATATIDNFGTIESPSYIPYTPGASAIALESGGTIVNGSATSTSATIAGRTGITFAGSGSITNFGTISGGMNGNAIFFGSGDATLIEEGTGVINGKVVGDGQNALVLGKEGGAGSITSLGVNITGFATISVASGAAWTFTGANKIVAATTLTDSGALTLTSTLNNSGTVVIGGTLTLGAQGRINDISSTSKVLLGNTAQVTGTGNLVNAGLIQKNAGGGTATVTTSISNSGTIEVSQGKLNLTGMVGGTGGTLKIDAQRTLELGGIVAVGQTVAFAAATGTLQLDKASAFRGAISGFAAGDKLDVSGFGSSSTTLSFTENADGTSGVLKLTSGAKTASLTIDGNHTAAGFHLATDNHGGSLVTYAASSAAAGQMSSLHQMVQAMATMTPQAASALAPSVPPQPAETHLAAAHT